MSRHTDKDYECLYHLAQAHLDGMPGAAEALCEFAAANGLRWPSRVHRAGAHRLWTGRSLYGNHNMRCNTINTTIRYGYQERHRFAFQVACEEYMTWYEEMHHAST